MVILGICCFSYQNIHTTFEEISMRLFKEFLRFFYEISRFSSTFHKIYEVTLEIFGWVSINVLVLLTSPMRQKKVISR